VQLRLGSDDDLKVWVNGEAMLSRKVGRGATIDHDVIPVKLRRGLNEVLAKVCNRQGGWGLLLRVTDQSGRPLKNLAFRPSSAFAVKKE